VIELPARKAEAWRWADLRHAEALHATPAPANDRLPDASAHWLPLAGRQRLFVGGRALDDAEVPEPDRAVAKHPLADLAAATATAGTTLRVPAGTDAGTVQIVHYGIGGAAHGVTRVVLGDGARLTLVETFADVEDDHWLNHRADLAVGAGARLERIVRVATGHGLVSDRAHAAIGRDGRFHQLLLATARSATRAETQVSLEDEGAEAVVNGILLGEGAAALDAATRIDHRVPGTLSRQRWRLVADGRAQLSVTGSVGVARHAQKTDADQSLKALVLARTAAANLKPELEIFADDVKCAHGATVGELDRQALFYLAQRGVPPAEARAILTSAFVADAFDGLAQPLLAETLAAACREWLESRAAPTVRTQP
jgi:Fe-S cluster assembly protein SufD